MAKPAKKLPAKKASVENTEVKKAPVKKASVENTEVKKAPIKKASVKKSHLLEHELAICKSNQDYIIDNLEMFTNGSTSVSK